jgi:hypothetical protein
MFVKQSMCVLFTLFFLGASSGLKSARGQELPPRSTDEKLADDLSDIGASINYWFFGGTHPTDPSTLDGMIRLQRRLDEAVRNGDVEVIKYYQGALEHYRKSLEYQAWSSKEHELYRLGCHPRQLAAALRDARARQAIEAANAQVRHAQSLVQAALRQAASCRAQSPAVPPVVGMREVSPAEMHAQINAILAVDAGLLQVTGPQQGYLGVRVGGADIFPFQQFRVTQSGQFFGGNLTLPQFGNGNRLSLGYTFFQWSGVARVAPTTVAGDFTLVPGVTTDGFSFNNIGNLAALGPQNFNINHRGAAFSATYQFGDLPPMYKLITNGVSVVPLVYAGFASKETNTGYNTTIPGYDTALQYRSDVTDQIFRGGVGVRLQTTLPIGNVPATFFVQGQIGAAHHQVASRELFDISIFNGAITAAEQTSIHGSATGLDWMAKFGANWLCQWPGGIPLQFGVAAFIGGDTKGGITREYLGGPPVLGFGAKEYWGLSAQARVNF